MEWANKLFGYGLLDPELEKRLSQQQRMQMGGAAAMDAGLAMLAGSGYSRTPQSLGQIVAQGIGTGRASYAAQAAPIQEQLQRQMQAEAEEKQRQGMIQGLASMDPQMAQFAAALDPASLRQLIVGIGKERGKQTTETRTNLQKEASQLFPNDPKAQSAWIREQRAKPTGTTVNLNTGAAPADPLSRIVTPEQRKALEASGVQLAPGTEYAWDKNNIPQPIKGTEPSKSDKDREGKAPMVSNAEFLMGRLGSMLDEGLDTGPVAGSQIAGIPVGKLWDYKRKDLFERQVNQLSSQIRSIMRIPGEGPLTDYEQRQYGLTLPSVEADEQTNRVIMENLRQMMANMQGAAAPQQSSGWRIVGVE